VDHNLRSARIDDAFAEKAVEQTAISHVEDRRNFDLEIFGKGFDLGPSAAAAVGIDADIGQVGHQQIGQIDEHDFAFLLFAFDW
jgi:hypothetical protein